jgi:protein TonB
MGSGGMAHTIRNLVFLLSLGLIVAGLSAADPGSEAAAVQTKPRLDPVRPLKPAGEHDPILSQLRGDAICKVKMTVNIDGSLESFSIVRSSGIPEIDQLCLNAFVGGRLLPATENGLPVSTTMEIPITWHPPKK